MPSGVGSLPSTVVVSAPVMEAPCASTPLPDLPAAVLDFETTGLRVADGHAVIEVGVVHVNGLKVCTDEVLSTLVDPGRPISEGSRTIHGIGDDELIGQPKFAEILPALLRMLDGRVIVAHNVGFDLGFLRGEMERLGQQAPSFATVDTVLLARTAHPGHEGGYGLDQVTEMLDLAVPTGWRHRALGDARVTAEAYCRMMGTMNGRGVETLCDLQRCCTDVAVTSGRCKGLVLPETVSALDQAVRNRSAVVITYVSPRRKERGRERTERTIEPIALRGLWVDAYCHLRGAMRAFRLDRIAACTPQP